MINAYLIVYDEMQAVIKMPKAGYEFLYGPCLACIGSDFYLKAGGVLLFLTCISKNGYVGVRGRNVWTSDKSDCWL